MSPPAHSERLSLLHLTTVTPAELTVIVGEEAEHLLGATRALVWLHPPGLNHLVRLQPSGNATVAVPAGFPFPETPVCWEPASSGLPGELITASFGGGISDGTVLAVPLRASGQLWALLVCRYPSVATARRVRGQAAAFGDQAGAVVANCAALEMSHRLRARLGVLYEVAGELSSKVLEPHVARRAIAERARSLVSADAAWMALLEHAGGQVSVPVAVGLSRGAFENVRLDGAATGGGLFRAVIHEGHPVWTSDYPADPALRHDPVVDAHVTAEGLRTVLGVPLRLGGRIIGGLFVGGRRPCAFSPEDIDILSAMADHAAIVNANAAHFENERRAKDELERARDLTALQHRRLERAANVQGQLTELVLSGAHLDGVAGLLSRLLGGAVTVLDANLRVVATAGDAPDGFERQLRDRRRMPGPARGRPPFGPAGTHGGFGARPWRPGRPSGSVPRLVVPIVAVDEVLGHLLVACADPSPEEHEIELVAGARVLALLMLQERSVLEAEVRLRGEFLTGLFSDRSPALENLVQRASLVGVDLSARYRLVVCRVEPGPATPGRPRHPLDRLGTLASEVKHLVSDSLAGVIKGRFVWLIPDEIGGAHSGAGLLQAVAGWKPRLERACGGAVVTAVVSPACESVPDYRRHFFAADKALDLLVEVGRPGSTTDLEELGSLPLLLEERKRPDIEALVDRLLGPVLDYDGRHGTALVETIDAYFAFLGNVAKVAKVCHLHGNSVYYRLERIRSLLGDDFDEPPRAFELQLALRARRLLVPAPTGSVRSPDVSGRGLDASP